MVIISGVHGQKNDKKVKKAIVIIPARDEEETISRVIEGCKEHAPGVDILVIDDCSLDKTAEMARKAGADVLSHSFPMGYGAALQTGYKYALEQGYELLVQLDGDGQHDPKYIPRLMEPIVEGSADITIGSRFLEKGWKPEISFPRMIGIYFFRIISGLWLHRRITDITSGYQAIGPKALSFLTEDFFPEDYPDADVILLLLKRDYKLKEVPVRMQRRIKGKSMHSGLKSFYYIYKVTLSISMNHLRKTRKRKTG